jgi:hypothetical protein
MELESLILSVDILDVWVAAIGFALIELGLCLSVECYISSILQHSQGLVPPSWLFV